MLNQFKATNVAIAVFMVELSEQYSSLFINRQ